MAELRTFVFTDLVGSVDLKSEMPGGSDAERDEAFLTRILSPHRERVEAFANDLGGRVVSTAGDGTFLVFGDAASAARWAMAIIRSHEQQPLSSPSGTQAQVRMSLHVGAPQIDPRDPLNFVGKAVDYAARLNDFSNGGQILTSHAARAILDDAGLNGIAFHSHGKRELKGIGNVEVHELLFDDRPPQDTRRKPVAEKPREWTTHSHTVTYSNVAGLLPDGSFPASATKVRPTKLGNYELGELVGAGGMGDVFKARHSQFGRLRAVKVIKPHLVAAGQHEVVKRFYQEIKAIGGLEHPNIVVAIDSSTPDDETHFLVMEYVDGTSAGELVDRFGPLSIANACEVARQTSQGLEYLLQQGMVHRDIKPSNLMVTTVASPHLMSGATPPASQQQPLVKILDLGLALLVGDDHERLTRLDHRAMGTAMYMSPEQWRTTSVDIRSDIYSLGCTLYHLLSGKPPFLDSELRPEKAHEKERVPSFSGSEQVPKALWNVIRKTLEKNPDDRYHSPAELAEALAPFAAGNTLVDLVEKSRRKPSSEPTKPGLAGETRGVDATHSDTLLSGRRPGSSLTLPPVEARRWLWGAGMAVALAIGVGVWFANQASSSRARLQLQQQEAAIFAAETAAKDVATEINNRFVKLTELSQSATLAEAQGVTLRSYMTKLNSATEGSTPWDPLQTWILLQKGTSDSATPADSWFLVSRSGIQVARAPHSETVGGYYAYRAYFHGQEMDLPEETKDIAPIAQQSQSAVYRSDTSKRLKVAFSVPVWSEEQLAADRQVMGVLAMSVDLGDFAVLEDRLPAGKEVLLVDMRADNVENATRQRGLILHHKDLAKRDKKLPAARLSPELLERVEQAATSDSPIVVDYVDPLERTTDRDKHKYWCAVKPVIIVRRRGDERIDTHWLVMVQERL